MTYQYCVSECAKGREDVVVVGVFEEEREAARKVEEMQQALAPQFADRVFYRVEKLE